ncbi:Bifunctional dehydrogenase and ferrochelatase [Ascosphaera acerosa]|nr:Bifunctional dehydrogenase and ferrochelatase [Ascosphaera acerosa]
MVFTALDDPAQSDAIWRRCKALRIPVNVADVPEHCDFYFGSVYRDGPLQVLISTNGNGPKMANLVKARIQAAMPENTGDAIRNVGVLRRKLREVAPAPEEGPKRMRWITKICEAWTFEDLVRMDEQCMDRMLACYASGRIPLAGDEGILQEKQCA